VFVPEVAVVTSQLLEGLYLLSFPLLTDLNPPFSATRQIIAVGKVETVEKVLLNLLDIVLVLGASKRGEG
jgi:hypothetical protein